jgi:hypothetical protein
MLAKLRKLSLRLLASAAGAILIVLSLVPFLGRGWHLFYGNDISYEGWTVPVPAGFYVRGSHTGPTMWKETFGMPFLRMPYGHISLFHRSQQLFLADEDYLQFKKGLTQDAAEEGYQPTSEVTIPTAIGSAYCLGFARSEGEPLALERCAVRGTGLVLFYEGDPRFTPAFFGMLKGMYKTRPATRS